MASTKVTFTLDQTTIARLQDSATRLSLPKSQVVREAIQDFHERIGQLSERERLRMLRAFDEMVPLIPKRSLRTVTIELNAIRRARKAGGRKSSGARSKS
jgi:predicted DNA-binding protein